MKLWDEQDDRALRTFSGHINEKNFVGLATNSSSNGDYIACGSENNTLYAYYKVGAIILKLTGLKIIKCS